MPEGNLLAHSHCAGSRVKQTAGSAQEFGKDKE